MKIDNTSGSAAPLRLPAKTREPRVPAAGGAMDRLTSAGNVRAFPEPADGTFDAAKVAAIREEIRSGRYRIDPERIAEGLLASVRDLLPGPKA